MAGFFNVSNSPSKVFKERTMKKVENGKNMKCTQDDKSRH